MKRRYVWATMLGTMMAPAILVLILVLPSGSVPPVDAQQAGLAELSLNVVPGTNLNCVPADKPDKCFVDLDSQFTLSADVNVIPQSGYGAFQVQVVHRGLVSKEVRHVSEFLIQTPIESDSDTFSGAALTGLSAPFPKSNYVGPVMEADLDCTAEPGIFKISLPLPGTKIKDLNGDDISITTEQQDVDVDGDTTIDTTKVADTLLINCLDRLTADIDGDGCTNEQELQPKSQVISGGGRDPKNFWDFAQQWVGVPPLKNGTVTVGDLGAVVARFGTFQDPVLTEEEALAEALTPPVAITGYHASADRSGSAGPNPWNLLPPNGTITVGDLGVVVVQFGHFCAFS